MPKVYTKLKPQVQIEVGSMRNNKVKIDPYFNEALSSLNRGNATDFEKTLKKLPDINLRDKDGRTLLFHAIFREDIHAIRKLIQDGSDVNAKDKFGWYPLHCSVNQNSLSITEILINSGATINSVDDYGNSVVWRAVFASKGYGDVINLLLANKADPSIKNNSGISALDLARTIANYNVLSFFDEV